MITPTIAVGMPKIIPKIIRFLLRSEMCRTRCDRNPLAGKFVATNPAFETAEADRAQIWNPTIDPWWIRAFDILLHFIGAIGLCQTSQAVENGRKSWADLPLGQQNSISQELYIVRLNSSWLYMTCLHRTCHRDPTNSDCAKQHHCCTRYPQAGDIRDMK